MPRQRLIIPRLDLEQDDKYDKMFLNEKDKVGQYGSDGLVH